MYQFHASTQLEEIYDIEVPPALISNVIHVVLDEVKARQSRPLSSVYPILYFDAIFVKSRQRVRSRTRRVSGAGVNLEGEKELWDCG